MITTLFYPLSRLVRTFLFIAVAQLLFCGSLVSAPLEITVGDTKERPLQHAAERIHISQSGIVDLFMPEKKKLSIHGINAGITTVTIEYANDKVEEMAVMVLPKKGASAEVIRDYVQKNLGGIDSLSFNTIPASSKTVQDKVAIAGAADMRYRPLVHSVSSLFPERIENKVQYKDSTVEETATFLKRALQSEKNVQISMTDDDKIQLQGKVDAERYPAYKQLVNSFSDVVKDSVEEVETTAEKQKKKEDRWENMMIQVDVEVVEVNLNELRAVGVEWLDDSNTLAISADASGSGDPFEFGSFSYSSSLNAENLKVTLQALANEGYGTILANPRLKVRNGEQASFVVGGEVPIVSTTSDTSSVEYKNFGTQLKMTPHILDKNRITLDLNATVSTLNFSNAVNGNPGIDKKDAHTNLTIRDGESFALAGLIERMEGENETKVPLLGDLPLVGSLFTSTNRNLTEIETLVIVTPHILHEGDKDRLMTERMKNTRTGMHDRIGNRHAPPFYPGERFPQAPRHKEQGEGDLQKLESRMGQVLEKSRQANQQMDQSEASRSSRARKPSSHPRHR